MAHLITETDGLVLAGKVAWHGLGRVVESAPTPGEALKLANLDWTVEQWALSGTNGEDSRVAVPSHVANVRSDTKAVLGVVGNGYVPVQNAEMAEFANLMVNEAGGEVVRVESAASIMGGKKVWFLLRAQSFNVKGFNDTVIPYILLANSHDGTMTFRVRPTSVRVVCSNTLTMAMGSKSEMEVRIRHEGNVTDKVGQVKRALGLFDASRTQFIETVNTLSARKMTTEDVQRFYLDVYTELFEAIPAETKTESARKIRKNATEMIAGFGRVYDKERSVSGDTLWTALNSVTGHVQNHAKTRGEDQKARNANRLRSKLFGTAEDRTNDAAKLALTLV